DEWRKELDGIVRQGDHNSIFGGLVVKSRYLYHAGGQVKRGRRSVWRCSCAIEHHILNGRRIVGDYTVSQGRAHALHQTLVNEEHLSEVTDADQHRYEDEERQGRFHHGGAAFSLTPGVKRKHHFTL